MIVWFSFGQSGSLCGVGGGLVVDDEGRRIENFSQVFGLSWIDMMSFAEIKGTKERKNHRSIINIPSYFLLYWELEVLLFHQVLMMDCLRGNYLSFSSAILWMGLSETLQAMVLKLVLSSLHSPISLRLFLWVFNSLFFPLKNLVVIVLSHSISTISSSWNVCINLQDSISKARLTDGKQKTKQRNQWNQSWFFEGINKIDKIEHLARLITKNGGKTQITNINNMRYGNSTDYTYINE